MFRNWPDNLYLSPYLANNATVSRNKLKPNKNRKKVVHVDHLPGALSFAVKLEG